jgi:hypothetical protein
MKITLEVRKGLVYPVEGGEGPRELVIEIIDHDSNDITLWRRGAIGEEWYAISNVTLDPSKEVD